MHSYAMVNPQPSKLINWHQGNIYLTSLMAIVIHSTATKEKHCFTKSLSLAFRSSFLF